MNKRVRNRMVPEQRPAPFGSRDSFPKELRTTGCGLDFEVIRPCREPARGWPGGASPWSYNSKDTEWTRPGTERFLDVDKSTLGAAPGACSGAKGGGAIRHLNARTRWMTERIPSSEEI